MTYTDLADAMMKGCAETDQIYGEFFKPREDGLGACAAGALILGLTGEPYAEDAETKPFWRLLAVMTRSPCDHDDREEEVSTIIYHLNDMEEWPREKIAGWLLSLDYPKEPTIDYDENVVRQMLKDIEPVAIKEPASVEDLMARVLRI